MRCPDCDEELVIVECDGVEVDVCHAGHGLWFDAQELTQLLHLAEAPGAYLEFERKLEALPASQGKSRRRCPRCRLAMRQLESPGHAGVIILDHCPAGDGLWFDRGELESILLAELGLDHPSLAAVRAHLGTFLAPSRHP